MGNKDKEYLEKGGNKLLKTTDSPIIPIEELFGKGIAKLDWQKDFEGVDLTKYDRDTYMPPFTDNRCLKSVLKRYNKDDWRWYCIYKDFWIDYDLCKNCKHNKGGNHVLRNRSHSCYG